MFKIGATRSLNVVRGIKSVMMHLWALPLYICLNCSLLSTLTPMPYSNTYWMCCLCWIYWPLSSSVVTTFWKFDGWLQATCIAVDVWAMCVKILEARQFSSILSMLSLMICFSGSKVLDCRYSLFPAMSPVRVLTRDIFGELSPGVFFKFAKSPVLMS